MLPCYDIFSVVAIHCETTPILLVTAYFAVSYVLACHQAGPGRCTDRAAGIRLCEEHALSCEAIYVGGVDVSLTVASQVTVAQVIAQDKHDVGLAAVTYSRQRHYHCAVQYFATVDFQNLQFISQLIPCSLWMSLMCICG